MPYPSQIRCLSSSYRARFSGWAIVPTHCHAESRGSCVSVSRVITYFTFARTAVSPTRSDKRSPLPLVRHPLPLPRIPSARAMKEEEGVAFRAPVFFIQLFDSLLGQPQ